MKRFLRKVFLFLLILAVTAGAAGAGLWYFRPDLLRRWNLIPEEERTAAKTESPDRIFKVKRGDMIIGVMLRGSVNAKKNYKLGLMAPYYGTKLVRVADENSRVKQDEIVAEYETSDLLTKIEDFKVRQEQLTKDLEIAREERQMLVSTNAADIRTAQDKVTEAMDSYKRYIQLEGPRERDSKNLSISDAEQALDDAKSNLEKEQESYDSTVFASESEETAAKNKIAAAEQKRDSAETKLETARMDLKLFKRYTYPNKLRELRNKLAQAKLGYEKERVRTQSSLAQKDNQIAAKEVELRNNATQLERHQEWLPMMTLRAPVAGIVTYGDPDAPPWRKPEVKVGMDGRRNQIIITIPDMTQIIVNASLPEQYRSRVNVGNDVIISPDSIREIRLRGKVQKIAPLPERLIMWDEGSPKIYRTVLSIEDKHDARIVSGMSVQAEVISRVIHNVLSIPIEAVFDEGGVLFVYRNTGGKPEKTVIKIGHSSDNTVEVVDGLKEGDEVYLYRPFQSSSSGKDAK